MSVNELLHLINALPLNDRKALIEKALKALDEISDEKMATAADLLLSEYTSNPELTTFTVLDQENFYEAR
jgi:hypothetical protein